MSSDRAACGAFKLVKAVETAALAQTPATTDFSVILFAAAAAMALAIITARRRAR